MLTIRYLHSHLYDWNRESVETPTDLSIQYILRHDQPMLLQVPHGPGQAVFVMHRCDDISRLILSFHVNVSAQCSHG